MRDDDHEAKQAPGEAIHLLPSNDEWMEMSNLGTTANPAMDTANVATAYTDMDILGSSSSQNPMLDHEEAPVAEPVVYKLYKIRWFGLMQLVLLNIVVSWDVRFTPTTLPEESKARTLTR